MRINIISKCRGLFTDPELEVISHTVKRFWFNKREFIDRCYTDDDLMQEGIIAYWQAKQKLAHSTNKIKPSPSRIVENRLLDILKKSNAQKRAEELFAESYDDLEGDGGDSDE